MDSTKPSADPTDVSEFHAPDAKVYLSPMIDCFDGKIVAWRTRRTPDKALTQGILEDAIELLTTEARARFRSTAARDQLVVHTDRGGHYRGAEWIEAMRSAGLTRSMGRKGKSGDNAACEGFFGRMKAEMYHGRIFEDADELEDAFRDYMSFYNNERIKSVLGGVTIAEYRQSLAAESSRKQS